ncbi:signal recognition particle subunit [Coemansia sp. RSA 1813]|nr:signal recognition particle subunit [Coemansia sp. RSA 1646]KAJ1765331.1 signal recognition particle subunit [Coemansia sp. RSA 1843]KAJ2091356.1 signal recognition particle subunit [Coemansia sp. RSA 986]KAJ2216548.1 signal recognition particle subunit [Coemansia sp. RSA 487]KAJ2571372.1 signal recognition particle subunit [Coemansia sp. RSA 1813]
MSNTGRGKEVDFDVDDMDFPLPEEPGYSGMSGQLDSIIQTEEDPGGVRIGQGFGGMRVVSDASRFKDWVCLYPLYFDKSRSLNKGRKVPVSLAIESPHGRQLSMAVKEVGLNVCYEPNKSHPRDFFTPGRVRVQVFDAAGRPMRADVPNRKILCRRVAEKMALVDAPRDKEPTLQDLIDSGAMPALPGVPPPQATSSVATAEASTSSQTVENSQPKQSKKSAKAKKKGKGKNIV